MKSIADSRLYSLVPFNNFVHICYHFLTVAPGWHSTAKLDVSSNQISMTTWPTLKIIIVNRDGWSNRMYSFCFWSCTNFCGGRECSCCWWNRPVAWTAALFCMNISVKSESVHDPLHTGDLDCDRSIQETCNFFKQSLVHTRARVHMNPTRWCFLHQRMIQWNPW